VTLGSAWSPERRLTPREEALIDFGTEFEKARRRLVGEYCTTFAWVTLIWRVSTLAMLHLTLRYANLYGRVFS
jgi:hypothetical protein